MIVSPTDQQQWGVMARFLQEVAGTVPTMDLKMIGWVQDGDLKIVVGFNGFIGKLCQMHVAMKPGYKYSPREMIYAVFHYVFQQAKMELVLAVVNSKNKAAMDFDLRMGFTEKWRIPKLHDKGGDVVVLEMPKANCRHLKAIYTPGAVGHA